MSPINFLKRREKPLAVVSDSFLNFYIQSFRKGEQVSQVRNNVWNANNFTLIMASLQRLYRPHCYNAQTLAALLKVRAKRADTQLSPSRKAEETLTKFTKAYSQARLSRKTTYRQPKQSQKKKTKKVYSQLFNEIKEIKQTLKESIANTSASRKRKLSKRSQKVLTQISDTDQMLRPSHSRGKNAYNYNDVLKHIEDYKKDYKNRYKVTKLQKAADLQANPESQKMQKTLFYGIDYIDSIQFKIKIKLSKAGYLLFAKNNNTKMMVEMSYAEYMRLNLSQLKGNPCRILAYLKIENNTVKLRLKNGLKLYTFKSFLSYY